MKALILIALVFLAGCDPIGLSSSRTTDTITCFSGGKVIYSGQFERSNWNEFNSGGWYGTDIYGTHVNLRADCMAVRNH